MNMNMVCKDKDPYCNLVSVFAFQGEGKKKKNSGLKLKG